MKKVLLILTVLPALLFSQNRIVFNNNSYMVIDNAANLVIDNPATTAITTLGTGGNMVSENETDVIKWNIGSNTGNYVIPWTTTSGIKIPLSINKTNAGVGVGDFILSTYETATDMNTPYPSAVTNMNSGLPTVDESLFVVDRFWHIDARSYTTKPNVTLVINYDPAPNEIGGTNTLLATNLLAQRFNTAVGSWQPTLFGTNDAANDRVTGINVTPADFFEDWILVDKTHPLPVTLVSFDANCSDNEVILNWTTQTEINNAYFVIEKSYDAVNFFDVTTLQGAGNSNVLLNYSYTDLNLQPQTSNTLYYRLKQVDFNGQYEYFNIESVNCKSENNGFYTYPNPSNGAFQIQFNAPLTENAQIEIYDLRGRIVLSKILQKGINSYSIDLSTHNNAIYFLKLQINNKIKNIKIIKH